MDPVQMSDLKLIMQKLSTCISSLKRCGLGTAIACGGGSQR